MKRNISLLFFIMLHLNSFEQELSQNFKIIQIDKKLIDFPDTLDLSSPLKSFITISYIMANGKNHLWRSVSTQKIKYFLPESTAPDSKLSATERVYFLNSIIKEIIIYKDSVACVISQFRETRYRIRGMNLENGKWVNIGEDVEESLESAKQHFNKYAYNSLLNLRKVQAFSSIPKDTMSFVSFVKSQGIDPKEFVLDKLNNFKLVMYGEIHRRKASWDFLQQVVKDKRFYKRTGVIFMEMASDRQKDIDNFLNRDSIDKELLLNVFRDYIIMGWNDKGMFDFVKCIWQINRNLPYNKKIRIIAADTPRPFSTFKSKEDMDSSDAKYDRDEFMAAAIVKYIKLSKDTRNALFIAGTGHVCKATHSAGSILSNELPKMTFSIFQHSPQVDNFNLIPERIRHGIFDYAFYELDDKPVAFELKNSPFGIEPFDGLFYNGFGKYQDNYDGYIFFGSLDNEPNGELLLEIYSDNFIIEMDRRYKLCGWNLKEDWGLTELSKEAIIKQLTGEQSRTRWGNIIKPLINGKIPKEI